MRQVLKKVFPLLFCLTLFFAFATDVLAITFTTDDTVGVCYDFNNGNYYGSGYSEVACKNKYANGYLGLVSYVGGTNNKVYAYCSDKSLQFAKNYTYYKDTAYSGVKTCTYKMNGKTYNDGDCSVIVGYLIKNGLAQSTNVQEEWYWTQASLWAYLANYSPSPYKDTNQGAKSHINNEIIKKVLNATWDDYAKIRPYLVNTEKDDVNFSVSVTDKKFYYQPSGNECGSGIYITNNIKIKNNENRAIKIEIPVPNNNVKVCIAGTNTCYSKNGSKGSVLKYTLLAGKTLEVYLSTDKILGDNVNLQIEASYEVNVSDKKTIKDSVRYKLDGYQGMIIAEDSKTSGSTVVTHKSDKKLTFSQDVITHYTCGDYKPNYDVKMNYSNTEGSPVTKKCANNADVLGDNKLDTSDYQVYFSGCNCTTISLDSNRKVGILLYETVGFSYGYLNPNSIYPGGGFGFSTDLTTSYGSKIIWQYADFSSNGNPYYYNKNNLSSNNALNIKDEIEKAIRGKINEDINFRVFSYDSNDERDTSLKEVKSISLIESIGDKNKTLIDYMSYKRLSKGDGLISDGGMWTLNITNLKMNAAYFSIDGLVKYVDEDSKYSIIGGNKYYIPLRYDGDDFVYNIGTKEEPTNLSILNNGNFWYAGSCDVDVNDNYLYDKNLGIRYRPINLSDPFPKAGKKEDVPYNWREWYWKNYTNINRLKNTFQRYPDSPLYVITLGVDKLNDIRKISYPYTSWEKINNDGSSKFVIDYFDDYANQSDRSYCRIGEFSNNGSVNCDVY